MNGFSAIRFIAESPEKCIYVCSSMHERLEVEMHRECQKFVMYRKARIRWRQWRSLHRIRALVQLIALV